MIDVKLGDLCPFLKLIETTSGKSTHMRSDEKTSKHKIQNQDKLSTNLLPGEAGQSLRASCPFSWEGWGWTERLAENRIQLSTFLPKTDGCPRPLGEDNRAENVKCDIANQLSGATFRAKTGWVCSFREMQSPESSRKIKRRKERGGEK